MTVRELLHRVYGEPLPKPLNLIEAPDLASQGKSIAEVAKALRTSHARAVAAIHSSDVLSMLGITSDEIAGADESRFRLVLGQLVLGSMAERTFEQLYRQMLGTDELRLRDDRTSRNDTDYFVENGGGRQIFRLNIKFHGSLFRKARDLVGLDPEDCFALATYKIHSALQKQDEEHLPYIFAVVSIPHVTGALVGASVPDWLPRTCAAIVGSKKVSKRGFEDALVSSILRDPAAFSMEDLVRDVARGLSSASWYVLSARKANNLLRDRLFERAYALRVRSFARNYGGAELDMHFSMADDLTPLSNFLSELRAGGLPRVVGLLERGTV